jgi:hypothetical protein
MRKKYILNFWLTISTGQYKAFPIFYVFAEDLTDSISHLSYVWDNGNKYRRSKSSFHILISCETNEFWIKEFGNCITFLVLIWRKFCWLDWTLIYGHFENLYALKNFLIINFRGKSL